MKQYWQVLRRNPEFAKLWLAQVISLTGDWFNTVVLSALVSLYTGGSGIAIGLFLLARFVPPLIVSPFAGVLIDRFNRKQLLIWSNLLRAMVVPFYLFAQDANTVWIIYVVSVVQFTLSAIFEPAQSAIIPSMLQEEDLITGNTFMSVTWSAMLALGAAFGGVFASVFGSDVALLFDAVTFLCATGLTYWARYTPRQEDPATKSHPADTSFGEGVRFIRRNPSIFWTLLVKGGASIGNVDTLLAILATQVFVVGAKGEISLSILYSVFGIGAFFGPVILNRWNDGSLHRMRHFVLFGFCCTCIAWFFMGASNSLLWLSLAILIRGVGGSVNWTFSSVMIQKMAPDAYLGRMFSLDFAFFQIATVLSTIVHGTLVDVVGLDYIRLIIFGTGVVCILPLVIWTVVSPRLEKKPIIV